MAKKFLKKLVGRLDRNLEGPQANFIEQFRYGHREVLILYANLPHNVAIRGSIEHGWSPFGPSRGVPRNLTSRYLHFAWSSTNMSRNNGSYARNVIAVGAPFLYLLSLTKDKKFEIDRHDFRRYLFIPPHGGETESPLLSQFISIYSNLFDPKDSAVQLYWTEFLNPEVRRLYEEAGFKVKCAGFCGMSINEGLGFSTRARAISSMGARNLFLLNTLKNLASHEEIVAGTFGTSTLYAGYLGKPVHLLPIWDNFESVFTTDNEFVAPSETAYYKYLRQHVVNEYFNDLTSLSDTFRDYCAGELGARDLKSREDLAKLIEENSFYLPSSAQVSQLDQEINLLL